MRAAITGPAGIRGGDWPEPVPGPGDVVVEVTACALNRNDAMVARTLGADAVIGSDAAGTVAGTGEEVVILPSLHWGPREDASGPDFEILGHPTQGTHAERVAVPAVNVFPRPQRLSAEESAALPLAGLTAWRALRRGRLGAGETVLVTGASGGVATFLVQIAAALGARVLVTSSSRAAIDRAAAIGADGGVGRTAARQATVDVGGLFLGQYDLLGTTMGSPGEFAALLAHVESAAWRPVVDCVLALERCAEAYARLDAGERNGKVVMTP